jgi:hypothetical protein
MLFSSTNTPPGFYHYLYLREDNTPYYSGKGKNDRAWSANHVIKPPKDHSRIVITHWGLTELWALATERWYIRWYGRIDNNTGILRNGTDGGDGWTNPGNDTRLKHRANTKAAMNRPETKERVSNSLKLALGTNEARERNRIAQLKAQNRPDVKKRKSESSILVQNRPEVKAKKSGRNNYRYDSTIFTFIHKDGAVENMPANDFCVKYNLDRGWLSNVILGNRKTIKGWRVVIADTTQ